MYRYIFIQYIIMVIPYDTRVYEYYAMIEQDKEYE